MSNISLRSIKYNARWNDFTGPFFTIITPLYNRRKTIERTLKSVEAQTYRSLEYIIIDDGSTESSDDIIEAYMKKSKLPICYVKKNNGGVHTARNIGYQLARGLLVVCIDSDDELTINACELFHKSWLSIPEACRNSYWQIKGLCVDEVGNLCSARFPENINTMSAENARQFFSIANGEQLGCRVVSILKNNLFPEPQGVKFVNENIIWLPMENEYLSWGLNEVVRVYHTEGDDRLSGIKKKKNIQACINALWNSAYELNHPEFFITNSKKFILTMIRFCIMRNILMNEVPDVVVKYNINGIKNQIGKSLLWVPSLFGSLLYRKYRM